MQGFTNVATFDVYQILTKTEKGLAVYAKGFAKYEATTDSEFSYFAKTEVEKYYKRANILDCLRVDFDDVNILELRAALR